MKSNRIIRIIAGKLIPIAAVLVIGFLISSPAKSYQFYTNPRPDFMVYAPMGGDGVWPGDTLFAYDHAVKLGEDDPRINVKIQILGHVWC